MTLIVFFAFAFLALFLFCALAIAIYRRLGRVLDSTERTLIHAEAATQVIANSVGVVSKWTGTLGIASLLSRVLGRKEEA